MKKCLCTVFALALVLILAACQFPSQPATSGNATDPLPSHVQQPEPTPEATQPAAEAPKLITKEEAIAIALQDAGFKESDVTGLHAELERDDGITIYDVDFHKDGKEYDYEIHAETGEILEPVKKEAATTEAKPVSSSNTSSSKSGNSSSSKSSSTASNKSTTSTPTAAKPKTTAKNITKDQAISKALSHAGLKKSQVRGLKAELDKDDGVSVYEVEFETADWEYDYEINAKTGKVRKSEKDRND